MAYKPRKKPAKKIATKKPPRKKARPSAMKKRLLRELGEDEGMRAYELAKESRSLLKIHLEVETFAEVLEEARNTGSRSLLSGCQMRTTTQL
jgi:hypothetical protein